MIRRPRIEYSDHALERMRMRKITRTQVADCAVYGELAGCDVRGRKVARKRFKQRMLIVVFVEPDPFTKMIVTTYWEGVFP
jgi:hypothetical protein